MTCEEALLNLRVAAQAVLVGNWLNELGKAHAFVNLERALIDAGKQAAPKQDGEASKAAKGMGS